MTTYTSDKTIVIKVCATFWKSFIFTFPLLKWFISSWKNVITQESSSSERCWFSTDIEDCSIKVKQEK